MSYQTMGDDTQPWTPGDMSDWTYELARSISILRDSHYRNCNHGDWSEQCPVFVAWDRRRPHPDANVAISTGAK